MSNNTFTEFLVEEANLERDDNPAAVNTPIKFRGSIKQLLRADIDAFDILESMLILKTVFEDIKVQKDELKDQFDIDKDTPSRKKGNPVKEILQQVKDVAKDSIKKYFQIRSTAMMDAGERPEKNDLTPNQQFFIIYNTLINEIIRAFKDYSDVGSILIAYDRTIEDVLTYMKNSKVEVPHADDVYVARKAMIKEISRKQSIRQQAEAIVKLRKRKKHKKSKRKSKDK